ncbi:LOW QUALITY PROTEIN: hypothetical protein V2J09_010205 [Rumex salicifolius]
MPTFSKGRQVGSHGATFHLATTRGEYAILVLHDPSWFHLSTYNAGKSEAYLPQLALILFLALLPKLLMYLSVLEGIPTSIFNAFIGVMVGGTVFSMLKTIEEDPHKSAWILATNLIDFLNYVAFNWDD